MRLRYKPKYGWLYALIVLCLLFSGATAWGLLTKLAQQQESATLYEELSAAVVTAGATVFETPAPTTEARVLQSEEEAEDQSDTVFYLNHDVIVLTPTLAPTQTPAPLAVAATATAKATAIPTTPAPTRTPTATPTVTVKPTAAKATATPVLSQTPAATVSPAKPAATAIPPAAKATATPAVAVSLPTVLPETSGALAQAGTPAATGAATPQTAALATTPSPALLDAFPGLATEVPGLNRFVRMDQAAYSVDFGYLQSINNDVKAWIVQDGTPINYPVLQGKNNDYYLERMFNRKLNKDGSIYLDSGSSASFIDANTYIYGHHTKTDSMFSTLAQYRDPAYYEAHPSMVLLTPYGDFRIDLFAARVCAVDDETTWRVKQFLHKSEFTDYLRALEAESLFKGHADAMPEWGDQLLVLVTCTNETHGERYVVYGRMRQIVYATEDKQGVTKMAMDQTPSESGWRDVPGRGKMMVYFQNDPLWAEMRYENRISDKRRVFGEGGCGPTSVAMAVANLVPEALLPQIFGYAKTTLGYTFCTCSVNQYFCNRLHAQYQVQTPEEYLRYLPLVMANFATGNNYWGEASRGKNAGTSLNFLKRIAYLYKLDLSVTVDNDETIAAVRNGAVAIASLSRENPFTGGGHYVVIASADSQYLYVLDPYLQKSYDATDKRGILTRLSKGVVRVRLEDARALFMSTCYILKTTPQTFTADAPAVQ